MRKDKEKALQLRQAGQSYKAIHATTGIPVSTLASWFKHEAWSREIRDRLAADASLSNPHRIKRVQEATRRRWTAWHQACQEEARLEFPLHKNDPLFIAGLMLYWGEGDRVLKNGIVRLGNSDPAMLKIFHLFLTKCLRIPPEHISAWILLYPDLVESVQKQFWTTATGIPLEQFKKSIVIKGRHPTKRLSYGVCYISVHSRKLKEKILKWLELIQIDIQSHGLKI